MAHCSTTLLPTMTPLPVGTRGVGARLPHPRLLNRRSPCPVELRRGYYHVVASFRTSGSSDEETDEPSLMQKISIPTAALVVCALLSGAVIPEEAFAARSGGRMGGSSFRSRAPSMPRGGGGRRSGLSIKRLFKHHASFAVCCSSYRQYNYYGSPGIAPPLVGGYGYGMGGYGLMPSFFFPIGFGGIFNIFIALFVLNAIVSTVQKFQNKDNDRDDFDDL